MNDILLNYIAQAILGGASGYITNDYAINMLFKEYTPLKIGGVIKKTRNEFIDNLSSMVENDIMNKEKLYEILHDDSFKTKFECLTDDFFQNCLYETSGSNKFSEISNFDSTIDSADKFVADVINEYVPEITNLIIDNFESEDLLTDIQLKKICDSLYDTLKSTIENTGAAEKILFSLYQNNKNLKIEIFFQGTDNSADIFVQNVINKLAEILKTDEFSSSVNEVADALNIRDSLNTTKTIFYDKELKDIVNFHDELRNNITDEFTDFINSERGKKNIFSLCDSLFTYGKTCEKSIFQLLDSTFETGLKEYISENLPHLTKNIVSWINDNGQIIDKLIEDSIDEVIKESDGLKGKLLSTIKNTYFNNLSQKYSLVQKIISYVETITEPEKLGNIIGEKIVELLNNLSVKEIILEAERNNFTSAKAANLVADYLNKNFEVIFNEVINNISKLHVKDILPENSFKNISLNNILTSDVVIEMLGKKSTAKIKSFMSLNLKELLQEEKAKKCIVKASDFVVKIADSNSNNVKEWINEQIKGIAADKNSLKNSTTYEKVSEEIYTKYAVSAAEVKNAEISQALDKLNSIDNISRNSSEALRMYVINNTDSILKGSIKGIVSSNLNKLSDDDLVNFANEFIGKELKPIMFFGGMLGIAAGIILAALQNAPVNPGEINISSMVTYSFVGFITNVVAINMLFKPYREKKLLSKIPLLRNFSLGFIIKNQKTFAKSTAHFIDNSLLSKTSINEVFMSYENNIKESFIKSVAENNYETLGNILISNKTSIVSSLLSYVKNKISNNISKGSVFIYNKAGNIKLSSMLADKVINRLSRLGVAKLSDLKNLSSRLYTAMNSTSSFSSKFSNSFIKKAFGNFTIKYYDKAKIFLSDESNMKNYILKYEDKYSLLTNKTIDDLLDVEKRNKISIIMAGKINSIILSQSSREKATQSVVNLFNRYFDKNKNFEELFNGKLKEYIDRKMPGLLKNISNMVKNNVKESKPKVALMVKSEIKNNLGFLERGMYTLVGGDEIVDELLKKIIEVKIPQFIDEKENEINTIANNILDEKFYKAKVQVLHRGLDKIQINELIDKYLDSGNSAIITGKVQRGIEEILKRAGSKNLTDILKVFYFNDIKSIWNAYEEELDAFISELYSSVSVNQEFIIKNISAFTDNIADEFMKTSFKEIFEGISQENLEKVLINAAEILNKDDFIEKIISEALYDYRNYVSNIKLESIVDKDEFIDSTQNYFKKLINSNKTENTAKKVITSVLEEAASDNFSFVDEKTKEYILNVFVDSCILSLKRNLDEILKAVEFDRIAQEEIEKMEPEKIHEMFNSFGEKYFKKLMLYGFGGFVFGINMYAGFALTSAKVISELFNNKKNKI